MSRILAFDPSESSGIAIGIIENKILTVDHVGLIIAKDVALGFMYIDMFDKYRSILEEFKPDVVIQETFFASGKFANGVDVNFVLRGLIKMATSERNIPLLETSPSEWKKFIAGRSSPTKEEKVLYKNKAKKKFIQEVLKKKGLSIEEKYVGPSGRMILVPSDPWDALAMLVYGAYLFSHVDEVNPCHFEELRVIR